MSEYRRSPQQVYAPAHAPGERPAHRGLGTTAFALGLTGSVLGLIRPLFWLAGGLGLLALLLGLAGRRRIGRGTGADDGMTSFGALLGVVALTLALVGAVLALKAVGGTTVPGPTDWPSTVASTGGPHDAPHRVKRLARTT
ncbi:hypothetical protein PUR49_20830 [Streptomyces sp. BE147]|uniref:hypothetical protein n=1 Tax=Streptomyces sp. BE147 TaxID=3002524 RepID=UPI002E7A0B61|nr:hypothetical protein [Streptomyces sp. BE147]MEE1738935.1 hypothetical protein [Streptomyces sp. BE147]